LKIEKRGSRHHIIPRSRGGANSKDNISIVRGKFHSIYHHLFSNMKPEEIVKYLNDYFWKGNYEIEIRRKR